MKRSLRLPMACLLAVLSGALHAQPAGLDPFFNFNDVGGGSGDGGTDRIACMALTLEGSIMIGGDFLYYNETLDYRLLMLKPDGTWSNWFSTDLNPGGTVRAMAFHPDGRLVMGGTWPAYPNYTHGNMAYAFQGGGVNTYAMEGAGADATVHAVVRQPSDGKILIGGEFWTFNEVGRNRIARQNELGGLDTSFDPGTGANGSVQCIAVQPDGKILIGGFFTSYNGTPRNRIARLLSNGSLDTGFDPGSGADWSVLSLALQPDGKILICGGFSSVNGTVRNRIARLNANGSLDTSFDPGTGAGNGYPNTMALQPDGKIIVGGAFTTMSGISRNSIARLNSNGTLDATFTVGTGANSEVSQVLLQPDGKVLLCGSFTEFNGVYKGRITRLNTDGSADAAFNPGTGANSYVLALARQPDGKLLLGGHFTSYNATLRNRIIRTHAEGDLDLSFNTGTGANDAIRSIAVATDGRILIAGDLTTYNGVVRNRLARLNADGTLDSGFNTGTGFNARVWSIAILPDGRILAVGEFTTFNGVARNGVAMLNADGSLHLGFDPGSGTNYSVRGLAVQPDGKILIGGYFTTYNGTARNRIARLNSDGSLDPGFDLAPGPNGDIFGIKLTLTGQLLICGSFTQVNGANRAAIAQLNADGSLDAATYTGISHNLYVMDMAVQPDGKVVAVGLFSTWNGVTKRGIVRLNGNGSLDAEFTPSPGTGPTANPYVYAVLLLPEGRILISGAFTSYNGTGRNRIARIKGTSSSGINVLLEGPMANGAMKDALRTLPTFPLAEPFTSMGYSAPGFVPGATIAPSVLSTTGSNAIVDWLIVEMRPVATPGTVAASRAFLLQRDGDVVALDGTGPVSFPGLAPGSYCVAVRPRNHLPVMLPTSAPINYGTTVPTAEFSLFTTLVHDNDARIGVGSLATLRAGDVNFNGILQYTGTGNDRDPILTRVGSTTPNSSVSGYWREDVNMDGVVKYTGSANDRDIILTHVGSTTPNNTRVATLP